MNWLIVTGGLGGFVVVLTAIIVIGRGIFRQISATEENTTAVRELASAVSSLRELYNGHETRIAVLEDRIKR